MAVQQNKMRTLLIICFFLMVLESILGVATLYTGILYRKFDRDTAQEMLEVVKNKDPNLYEKIINPDDNTYLREFENSYTEKRHTMLMVFGGIMTLFSFGCIIPLTMLLMPFIEKRSEGADEKESKRIEHMEDEF